MIRFITKRLGRLVRCFLPERWVRTLRKPALVPSVYAEIIDTIERIRDETTRGINLDEEYWSATLRKYVHIMDKGMERCDFEAGHSVSFYRLSLDALSHIQSPLYADDPSIRWAEQTLERYRLMQDRPADSRPAAPGPAKPGELETLEKIIRSRRSIRSFLSKRIDRETIDRVIDVINRAPRSCNRQTARVFVTDDPGLAERCRKTCLGATCFSDFTPIFMAFCADLRSYVLPAEMSLPAIDVSLGAQNCCLVASALGLSLTLLSWCHAGKSDQAMLRELLSIPGHFQIVFCGIMGYPDHGVAPMQTKSVENTRVYRDITGQGGPAEQGTPQMKKAPE
ncbi:nitroreductase family protein [bacterium]|nr:nitroreductase family protein [candidate division CSSED10-310 bacterium]